MTVVRLLAPLAGWATPLAEVPDPAFAQGFVGDGIAIDPTESELRAPCDGTIVVLHRALHACTIRAANGAEILMHIGVDTVAFGGEGFTAFVKEGQAVTAGEPLIRFDMDRLLDKAPSLLTMVVVVNGDDHPVVDRALDREVTSADVVLSVEGTAVAEAPAAEPAEATYRREVVLPIATGLHARPAAVLASAAREHSGGVTIACRDKTANAKSVVALLGLGTVHGDRLTVSSDDAGIVDRLAAAIAGGLGDPVVPVTGAVVPPAAPSPAPAPAKAPATDLSLLSAGAEVVLSGTTAVPGLALGPAVRLFHAAKAIPETGADAATEKSRLDAALGTLAARLDTAAQGQGETAAIFRAHRALLDDPDLTDGAAALIAQGKSAEWAWNETVERTVAVVSA